MLRGHNKKQGTISWAVLLCIGIVTIFSYTARFIGESVQHTPAHQVRHTSFLGSTIAEAATLSKGVAKKKSIDAKKLIQSAPSLSIHTKEKKSFEVGYKNTGISAWKNSRQASSIITLRSYAKKESFFYDPSWESGTIVARLPHDTQPGEVVYFRFLLEAPKKSGSYTEKFALYQGGHKLSSSDLILPIEVADSWSLKYTTVLSGQEHAPSVATLASLQPQQFLEAQKMIQSHQFLKLESGSTTVFDVGYKNIGKRAWRVDDTPKVTLRIKSDGKNSFADTSWHREDTPAALSLDTVSGSIAYFRFLLKAPAVSGYYTTEFYLFYGDQPIIGSKFLLPVEVIGPILAPNAAVHSGHMTAAQPLSSPSFPTPADTHIPLSNSLSSSDTILVSAPTLLVNASSIINNVIEKEPLIRIGYFSTTEPVRITAQTAYEIRDGNNSLMATEQAGSVSTVTFDKAAKTYLLQTPTVTSTLQTFPRFTGVLQEGRVSLDPNMIFEIVSYSNRPAWSSVINDNKVRGAVEIRYSEKSEKIWVINELPLEYYLRGLAETSNNSPYEFQKALVIAARTYAKYHIEHNTKYAGEYFTIRSTDHDQVYRGYGAEIRLPNVTRASDDTRGVIVHYQGALAITPYYSQSDGRTRSWEEVWAGGTPKPWLVSKEDPAGRGLPLLGHGVGMPARGAIALAFDNKTFEDILKYYYTGIELQKKYE